MNLRLSDPSRLREFKCHIKTLGNSVNDLTLFERILEACLNQRAFLFVSDDGFFVLKPEVDQGVLIWVAQSFAATDKHYYFAEIEHLARLIGVNRITFWSNRKGFHKIAPRFGFTGTPSIWMGMPITIWIKPL